MVTKEGKRWRARLQDESNEVIADLGLFDSKQQAEVAIVDAETNGYYTPDPFYHKTHAEIAAELGITRQAVSAIEKRALKKLRKSWILKILGEYL